LIIRALDQWKNSVYSEVPRIFANSKEVLRTPFPLLLPQALCCAPLAPLPSVVSTAHRRFSSSPAPPPAALTSTRCSPLPRPCFPPLLAFPARATPTRAPLGRHLTAAVFHACACSSSFPLLPSSTSKTAHNPFPSLFLAARTRSPEYHRRPPSCTPATLCLLWTTAVRLPLPIMTPWAASPHLTDAPRPLLVAGLPPEPPRRRYRLTGVLLSPSNPYLRSFSTQLTCTNSFLFSCCSFWTGALPHFLTGILSPTSSPPRPPRPPWEPHLRSSLPLPKTPRRCALSS
jgi:hypothetical protein